MRKKLSLKSLYAVVAALGGSLVLASGNAYSALFDATGNLSAQTMPQSTKDAVLGTLGQNVDLIWAIGGGLLVLLAIIVGLKYLRGAF